jgi:hypothetical protein
VVEGQVKFTRLNFFVPVPPVRDFTELNASLRQQCVGDRERRLRGQAGTKAELLKGDQAAFLSLPSTVFAACQQVSTTVSSLSLVRFDTNDYSVPVRWEHHSVVVKGYCQEVRLYAQGPQVPHYWTATRRTFRPPFTGSRGITEACGGSGCSRSAGHRFAERSHRRCA